jgi:hypothetical protein
MARVAKCLLSKCKALSSNPNTTKKKMTFIQRKRKRGENSQNGTLWIPSLSALFLFSLP